jgi:hypothetical protein
MPSLGISLTKTLLAPAAAPPAWVPTDIGATTLLVWYEGDGITQADGSAVTSWTDLSGNNRHATEATNTPTYETNELNGKPVIRFDATNDKLTTASVAHGIGTGDYTIALVVKTPSTTNSGYRGLVGLDAAGNICALLTGDGGGLNGNLYQTGDRRFDTDLAASTWYTLIFTRTGTSLSLFINGTEDVDTALTSTQSIPNAAISLAFGTTVAAGMDFAAVLVTKNDIGATRSDLEAYWRTKYAHY